jgi:5'-nucleotidase
MFNIFPFDNSISKMQLSGVEVQDLFDFAARRASGRGCVSQVQIAGARVVTDCTKQDPNQSFPGVATNIYIGQRNPKVACSSDSDCPDKGAGSCDIEAGLCWLPIDPLASYELATSNYLAQGGSGFRVLQRNTTQFDTLVQQRDALIDYISAGEPCKMRPSCPADKDGDGKRDKECTDLLRVASVCTKDDLCEPQGDVPCKSDKECSDLDEEFICACPESIIESEACETDPARSCNAGVCVLKQCRTDIAAFQRQVCDNAPSDAIAQQCEAELSPCRTAGEQCKFLACVDRYIGNFSDGRLRMVGQ